MILKSNSFINERASSTVSIFELIRGIDFFRKHAFLLKHVERAIPGHTYKKLKTITYGEE